MLFPESAGPRLCDKDVKITDPPPGTLFHVFAYMSALGSWILIRGTEKPGLSVCIYIYNIFWYICRWHILQNTVYTYIYMYLGNLMMSNS